MPNLCYEVALLFRVLYINNLLCVIKKSAGSRHCQVRGGNTSLVLGIGWILSTLAH